MTDKLITIANFIYGPDPVSQAHLARIKLESHGINSFLAGENLIGTYWLISAADNGVKLQVRQSDAAKALEILESKEQLSLEKEDEDLTAESPNLQCPKCNSEDIEYERFSKNIFYLSLLVLGFPLPFAKNRFKCENCEHQWKQK